jgi:hypothetical protein
MIYVQGTPAESLRVLIVAEDGGVPMLSTTHTLTLLLDDINEYPPVFQRPSYMTSVQNTAPTETYFIQVTATDRDGRDNIINYDLVPDSSSGNFSIDANGVIRNTRLLGSQVSRDTCSHKEPIYSCIILYM